MGEKVPPDERDDIKGASLREFLGWYVDLHGPTHVRDLLARLPEESRGCFDPELESLGVLASNWYPAHAIHALLDAMTDAMGPAAREHFARTAAEAVMKRTLSGVYRTLFRAIATPERYAKLAPLVWSHYYRSGEVVAENAEPGVAISCIQGWRAHHPVLCDMNRAASVVIYEVMGGKNVTCTRDACIDDGAPYCRFTTRWL